MTTHQKIYIQCIKRTVSIIGALTALIILSPIFVVTMAMLRIANKRDGVFFFQERPGHKGKLFKVWKFKSMTDAKDENGKLLPNDQRITKVGRFIRKTSIDELPQLFNILKGDMSFIGPRPLMPRYLQLYSNEQMRRHDVLPGMSGWAQVNGRNNITWTEKFRLDVWYVDNVSLILDLRIIFMTVINVIRHKDIDSKKVKVGNVGFDGTN